MNRFPLLAVLVVLAAPQVAAADGDPPAPAAQSSGPDFLFQMPKGSFSFRWTTNVLNADSDWFGFVRDQLTLDRGDFVSMGIAGDVSFSVTPRFDAVISADFTGRNVRSEYRDFVDNNRLPIEQNTRMHQTSFTGGVRYTLIPRGRLVSSLAYVPARLVPYVGGGAGVMHYSLLQYGDFVDIVDLSVFADQLPSEGWTPTAYVNGGIDWLLVKKLAVTVDVRYQLAAPELNESAWTGFEPLELSGVRVSTGIRILF
jgi:opacity protein-like surface antigen